MNKIEMKRLMELASKVASHSEAEKTEYATLQAKMNAVEDSDAMSQSDVQKTVEAGVKAALGENKNVTAEQVKACVETALKALPVTEKLDTVALVAQVKAAITPGLGLDDVKAVVNEAFKAQHKASKMEHEVSAEIDFPISHRSGNLAVSQKQLLNIMLKRNQDDGIPESILKQANERGERAEKRIQNYGVKALTAGSAGNGADLLNVSISSVLLTRMYLQSQLAQSMISREIQMPSNPYNLPLGTTRPVFKSGIAESATATESSPGTGKVVLNAGKLMGMSQYSDEADEDSIIAILPMITEQLGTAAADALEQALINGDTAGSQDTGGSAGDALRLFDGIRKLTLAQATLKVDISSGGITATNIGLMRKALGRWGLDPSQLLLIVGPRAYNDIVLLPETLTAEKAGGADKAKIYSGTVANIFGIDIIPSAQALENLNASGVFDNTTTTKGAIYMISKPSWIQGVKRGFNLETFRDPRAGTNFVVASFRRAFVPLEALTLTKAGVTGYNYTA